MPLSKKHRIVLYAVQAIKAETRKNPTLEEVVARTGMPRTTVWRLIGQMEGQWMEPRKKDQHRQLRIKAGVRLKPEEAA